MQKLKQVPGTHMKHTALHPKTSNEGSFKTNRNPTSLSNKNEIKMFLKTRLIKDCYAKYVNNS